MTAVRPDDTAGTGEHAEMVLAGISAKSYSPVDCIYRAHARDSLAALVTAVREAEARAALLERAYLLSQEDVTQAKMRADSLALQLGAERQQHSRDNEWLIKGKSAAEARAERAERALREIVAAEPDTVVIPSFAATLQNIAAEALAAVSGEAPNDE